MRSGGTLLLDVAHVSTARAHLRRHCDESGGTKRSLKIRRPSVATPSPTPPIEKGRSLVWSWIGESVQWRWSHPDTSSSGCSCHLKRGFTETDYWNYWNYWHIAKFYSLSSELLSIPLFPQDVRCNHNLFYMTKHISAAQMLPRPPRPRPRSSPPPPHTSLLQLPSSTCGPRLQHPIH